MATLPITQYFPNASSIAYGCMGLGGGWDNNTISQADEIQAQAVIETALANGINYFDHADIYTHGKAEQVFGKALKDIQTLREKMIIQSKCGIRFDDEHGPGRYDFSADWITSSVDDILSRLGIEQLDVLQLHRPDPLMELDEVATTLQNLQANGKVKHFGVSNMNHHQIAYLQPSCNEFSIVP